MNSQQDWRTVESFTIERSFWNPLHRKALTSAAKRILQLDVLSPEPSDSSSLRIFLWLCRRQDEKSLRFLASRTRLPARPFSQLSLKVYLVSIPRKLAPAFAEKRKQERCLPSSSFRGSSSNGCNRRSIVGSSGCHCVGKGKQRVKD